MSAGIAGRCWAASPAPRTLKLVRPSIRGQRQRPLANHDGKSHVFLNLRACLIDCKQSIPRRLLNWQRASTRSAMNPSLSISHHNLPFPEATEIAAALFLT